MSDSLVLGPNEGVHEVTINPPVRRNTIDGATARLLSAELIGAGLDHACGACSSPGPVGLSMPGPTWSEWATRPARCRSSTTAQRSAPFYVKNRTLWQIDEPVVSAVNGTDAVAGWSLALSAELAVAARYARWTHVFLHRGTVSHAGDTIFFPRVHPLRQLTELAVLNETVTSEEIGRYGAINRLADPDQPLDTARDSARPVAQGPTPALGLTTPTYRNHLNRNIEKCSRTSGSAPHLPPPPTTASKE